MTAELKEAIDQLKYLSRRTKHEDAIYIFNRDAEAIYTVVSELEKPNICTCGSKNYGYGFAKCYDCGKIKEETK